MAQPGSPVHDYPSQKRNHWHQVLHGDCQCPARRSSETGSSANLLRALKTLPKVQVTLGHFLQSEPWMPKYPPATLPNRQQYVQVIKTEEKGSDVNLAVDMVYDACVGAYEVAVVVSNDSDLERAIRLVRQPPLNKKVGIINPHSKPAQALLKAAHFYKPLRARVLAAHQFPPKLADPNGEFHKPKGW